MSDLRSLDVVCVGEAAWDLRALPGMSLDEAEEVRLVPGGGAVLTAIELSRLGARAALCAAFGDDPIGRGLLARVGAAGVDVRFVRLSSVRTGLVFIGASRDKDGGQSFVSYRDPEAEARALEVILPDHFGARVVHLSALIPTRGELHLFHRAVLAAHRDGALLSLDLNARPRFFRGEPRAIPEAIIRAMDVIKCAQVDLQVMGLSSVDDLRAHARPDAVILSTSGAGPVRVSGPFGAIERSPAPIDGVDPTGAGDAFCAGFLAELTSAPSSSPARSIKDAASVARALDRAMDASRSHLMRRVHSAH
jgi:sugar/nucleoside kinase (ribokinase family)